MIDEKTREAVDAVRRHFEGQLHLASWIHPNTHERLLAAFDRAVLLALDPEEWERRRKP